MLRNANRLESNPLQLADCIFRQPEKKEGSTGDNIDNNCLNINIDNTKYNL